MHDQGRPLPHFPVMKSLLCVAALARTLEAEYGLAAVRCQLIKATIRDTYRVWSRTGSYILSIYRHAQRTPAEIAAELDIIEVLAAGGVAVAPAVRRWNGERLLTLPAPEGPRPAVLFTYVAGQHLSRSPEPEPVRRYGRAIAQLHGLTDALPDTIARPPLDVTSLVERPLAALTAVVTHRPADLAYLRTVAAVLGPRIDALPRTRPHYGLVHGDVIPSNAQVSPDGQVTLLDFDFCGPGWRVYDIATYLKEVEYWQALAAVAQAFLDGYQEVRPLADWEVAAIPLFAAARNIFSLGIPAMYVDEWGSAYLSDRMIDRLLDGIKQAMAQLG